MNKLQTKGCYSAGFPSPGALVAQILGQEEHSLLISLNPYRHTQVDHARVGGRLFASKQEVSKGFKEEM